MSLIERTAELLYEKTKERPLFLHMDAVGFLNFGGHTGNNIQEIIENKLKKFNEVLILSEELGANILVPTFTYSITDGKKFDVLNSISQVGSATDFFRKMNPTRRTKDPIFSYVLFSKNEKLMGDLKVKNFNTFGKNSIIDKVFKMGGYIGSIGGVLFRMTEAHYLEKKLNVPYRFDKQFQGQIINDGHEFFTASTFFCRDLSVNYQANFKPLVIELEKFSLIEQIEINSFQIEIVEMNRLYSIMKKKYKENKMYFLEECI